MAKKKLEQTAEERRHEIAKMRETIQWATRSAESSQDVVKIAALVESMVVEEADKRTVATHEVPDCFEGCTEEMRACWDVLINYCEKLWADYEWLLVDSPLRDKRKEAILLMLETIGPPSSVPTAIQRRLSVVRQRAGLDGT